MRKSNSILKPLAEKCKWAFLFIWNKAAGMIQTAWRVLCRKALMWNIYTTCYDLPRERYIRMVCENDFRFLKRTFLYVPEWLLLDIYTKIMEEYTTLSDNKEVDFQKIKRNELSKLQENALILNLCYNSLIAKHNIGIYSEFVKYEPKQIIEEYLSKQGIKGVDTADLLLKLEKRIKNANFQFKQLLSELKEEKKDIGVVTRQDYESISIILEKNGYRLGKSTANFIIALNLQRKEQQDLEKQLKSTK